LLFNIIQALSGLVELHRRRILHWDVKPGNILLSSQHGIKLGKQSVGCLFSRVKHQILPLHSFPVFFAFPFLADFGFVVQCEAGKGEVEGPAWPVGTSLYLPPEVLIGALPYMRKGLPGVPPPPPPPSPAKVLFSSRTDVWAIGITAAELLCGCHPYGVKGSGMELEVVSLFFFCVF
jgi:serine/threonine protein kinase